MCKEYKNMCDNRKKNKKIELSYIFINDDKKNIDEGFNFGSEYLFNYSDNKIIIVRNTKYIENFFSDNIINISVIIGKNGVGKSTILHSIRDNLFNNKLIIFRKEKILYVIYNSISKPQIDSEYFCDIKYYSFINNSDRDSFTKDIGGKINIAYFTNTFGESFELAQKDESFESLNYSVGHIISNYKGDINKFFQYQTSLMINFICKNNDYMNNIVKPSLEYIQLILNEQQIKNKINMLSKKYDSNLHQVRQLEECIFNGQNKNESYYFKNICLVCVLEELSSYKYENDANIIDILIDFIRKINNDNFECILTDFLNMLVQRFFAPYFDCSKIKNKYLDLYNSFIMLKNRCDKNQSEVNQIILKINNGNLIALSKFIGKYLEIINGNFFIYKLISNKSLQKRYLSSGEEALLKMYASLYEILCNNFPMDTLNYALDKKNKNILLLIDEPEVYLHPAWQRKIIWNLVNFFNDIYAEYNVQIILTSNTPYFISDLPKENIILLEKHKSEENYFFTDNKKIYKYIVQQKKIDKSTFGQNIHDLLAKTFFMEYTIGEFSKNKIDKIIEILNKSDNKKVDAEKLRCEIELIGEPIIKNKLMAMYNEKFISNKDRIEIIERKIKELQKQKMDLEGKKNND